MANKGRTRWKKGQSGNPAGPKPGTKCGPKPDWFKERMRELGTSKAALAFLEALVNGEPIEEKVLDTPDGEPQKLLVAAPAKVRLDALKECWDRGFGKAPQALEVGGPDGGPVSFDITIKTKND